MNCVLALKAYSDWKQGGGIGSWKLGGNLKPVTSGKHFMRKNSEPFMNSFSRISSASEQSLNGDRGHDLSEAVSKLSLFIFVLHFGTCIDALPLMNCLCNHLQAASGSLNLLVQQILSGRKQEEIPIVRATCHFITLYWLDCYIVPSAQ